MRPGRRGGAILSDPGRSPTHQTLASRSPRDWPTATPELVFTMNGASHRSADLGQPLVKVLKPLRDAIGSDKTNLTSGQISMILR